MSRGINKQNMFEDEENKQKFIEALGYYKHEAIIWYRGIV